MALPQDFRAGHGLGRNPVFLIWQLLHWLLFGCKNSQNSQKTRGSGRVQRGRRVNSRVNPRLGRGARDDSTGGQLSCAMLDTVTGEAVVIDYPDSTRA